MAGVGFELKKLFREQGLAHSSKAYVFSTLTTIGPMMLCMFLLVAMQKLMSWNGASFLEKELFMTTMVYGFVFSVLLTGGLTMLLNRYIADLIFAKRYDALLSSSYGAAAVALPAGSLAALLFLRDLPVGDGYKLAAYLLFSLLSVIWVQSVYLTALKDYRRIVRSFLFGTAAALAGAWLVLGFTPFKGATAALLMADAGFLVMVLLSAVHFQQIFPRGGSRLSFEFLSYFRKYPSLFLIGTFFYAGVYIHSMVYWLGPYQARVAEKFLISPLYDLPVFYAYLTVVPTLVTFVVSVETSFYEKYREYYMSVLHGGTLQEIKNAKISMQRTLVREIGFMMEVQLLFTVVSVALGFKLLPLIGFSMAQLDIFLLLVLGYYAFIIAFIVMLIMLYYDDRKGVLVISSLFIGLNATLTYWTMSAGNHGFGMFLASFVTLAAALARLMNYVRNIDYHTFSAQPLVSGMSAAPRKAWKLKAVMASLLLLVLLLGTTACSSEAEPSASSPAAAPAPASGTEPLSEDKHLYERDDDLSVANLYVTVMPGSSKPADRSLNWYSLNRIQSSMEEGTLRVLLQEGGPDGKGPQTGMFGYGTTEANAKISLRGNTSRYESQRSYKIRLDDQAGLWHDQRILNLNKHPYDTVRFRNKLSFDLLETLPNMASLRTQFTHVYVKDLSSGAASKGFQDYGLYTHVEQPGELFLKNHWLDPGGQLYKASMFEFRRSPETLKLATDPAYNKQLFEQQLEIKGSDDHSKLLAMLDDVNNMAIPIDEVIEKHFDRENYLTWLAANLLMDNMDTEAHNFLLYSPLNSQKWYFIPWDYDGAWEWEHYRNVDRTAMYGSGISNYWSSVLHNRYFRSEEHVRLLKDKMDELYGLFNKETVGKKIEDYRKITLPFMQKGPDKNFLPIRLEQAEEEITRIADVPLRSMERFKADLEKPKPVFLGEVASEKGQRVFVWEPSFDLQGDDLTYDWTLAADPAFTQVVKEQKGLKESRISVGGIEPGTYYWKVVIHDGHGHEQIPFDIYFDTEGTAYNGVKEAKVE
ncbi:MULTISPECIES: exopolysaccharide Pel transporter PelG [Paenibacillus]|uniref:exopolysaccharide Pel transporter PelG n=1 Tax=Paenibacillus TaxID=44249 RepID=UPI0022B8709B|nr:exopolysaccharide Pel transporter PelG [Paenibacillus caseinilyticus]MCZ8518245.1 exopolysaccharide Pel transporter PelG [Paenibacillus caseinilyticus]